MTKGNQAEQADKLARSGLASYFSAVEIVAEKDPATYREVIARHELSAAHQLDDRQQPQERHQPCSRRRSPRRLPLSQRHMGAGTRRPRPRPPGQHLLELDSFAKLCVIF